MRLFDFSSFTKRSYCFNLLCISILNNCVTVSSSSLLTKTGDSYSLVLCTGLDNAIHNLRSKQLSEHNIGAMWLEENCVTIDVCNEIAEHVVDEEVARGEWIHANSTALRLTNTDLTLATAHNYGSLEYARIPEGLKVESCVPDFDVWGVGRNRSEWERGAHTRRS